MAHDIRTPVLDILNSADIIARALQEHTLEEYLGDVFLRSIVERQFITIGEALSRIRRIDSSIFDTIPNAPAIVAFRNVLVHGYDAIDDEIVWIAATTRLKTLTDTLRWLMHQSP
jgi:uncharacterized protein with HEPN domain